MGIENRLDELQVQARRRNVRRWCATDIYFLRSSLHLSSWHSVGVFFFLNIYLSLPFISISYLTLIGKRALPGKICSEPHQQSGVCRTTCVSLSAETNNWTGNPQCKHAHLWAGRRRHVRPTWSQPSTSVMTAAECGVARTPKSEHKPLNYCPVTDIVWGHAAIKVPPTCTSLEDSKCVSSHY